MSNNYSSYDFKQENHSLLRRVRDKAMVLLTSNKEVDLEFLQQHNVTVEQ